MTVFCVLCQTTHFLHTYHHPTSPHRLLLGTGHILSVGTVASSYDVLRKEADALWAFRDHPNIVAMLGVVLEPGSDVNIRYIVMEVAAGDVATVLDAAFPAGTASTPDRLSPEVLKQFCVDVLAGLHAIHSIPGGKHRDIKPQNLLVLVNDDNSLQFKIGDVGVARIDEGTATTTVGSAFYSAPEVSTGAYDSSCDMFSFGVSLAELVVKYMAPPGTYDGLKVAPGYTRDVLTATAVQFARSAGGLNDGALAELIAICCNNDSTQREPADICSSLAASMNPFTPSVDRRVVSQSHCNCCAGHGCRICSSS